MRVTRSLFVLFVFSLLLLQPVSASARLEPYALANRLGVSFGFGFGSAGLSSFHRYIDEVVRPGFESTNKGSTLDRSPTNNLQINAEIAFRYYFPRYVMAHLGYDAVYNHASANLTGGSMSTYQLAMELPILVGAYYPFWGRLNVFSAIGPSPFFYGRSWIGTDPGAIEFLHTKTDAGVGFHFVTGAEFMVTRSLALGMELRYRHLRSGDIKASNSGTVVTPQYFQLTGNQTYKLDLSGISLGFTARVFFG